MNSPSNHPLTLPFLTITAIMTLGAVMIFLILTGAPPNATAQQGYPAPIATTAPPAYPAPAEPTATRPSSPTASPTVASPTVPAPVTRVPETPTFTPALRPTLTPMPSPTRTPPMLPRFGQVAEATPATPGVLQCAPGQTILITGVASPRAPLLIFFGTRIVGGGSASASGDFALPLTLGMERAGEYQVTVRVRGIGQIVRSLTCQVPPTTPTPVPRRLW
ncbi:MAG: hypothetical protein NZ699_07705 [Roseiflexus sp.]|nr:hypothetical protein [Roseiflexus sp.]MCS7289000.1 hypothetical protein [Roseiflexus sp.]MDW8147117.1 hypothetical protein [Roseiflexaceae bacterium]MDW8231694.1 hypothetical protein [Roseiflexaceae bacterium]